MTRKVFGWLVARDRYWMANRLEQCGLQHPTDCPFCDQQLENLQHILLGSVYLQRRCGRLSPGIGESLSESLQWTTTWWIGGRERKLQVALMTFR
uniref:Reverse transcriptase zinc-binding domain-containing protein n=1 Tax=Aegilops tauschii subsp. strangulata TaxID=200361 RepID=A0A453J9H4_AEGTS